MLSMILCVTAVFRHCHATIDSVDTIFRLLLCYGFSAPAADYADDAYAFRLMLIISPSPPSRATLPAYFLRPPSRRLSPSPHDTLLFRRRLLIAAFDAIDDY